MVALWPYPISHKRYCWQYYYAAKVRGCQSIDQKTIKLFHLRQFAIYSIFKCAFRLIYENIAVTNYCHIHSSQLPVNFRKCRLPIQKLVQKRKISQSSSPAQCSIPVVHSTVCTYPFYVPKALFCSIINAVLQIVLSSRLDSKI